MWKLTAAQFEGHFKNRTRREGLHFQILMQKQCYAVKGADLQQLLEEYQKVSIKHSFPSQLYSVISLDSNSLLIILKAENLHIII